MGDLIERVASAVREAAGEIAVVAYLFGSAIKPHKFKGDLDIALLVEEEALREGVIRVQTRIYLKLRRLLGRDDIDVVILNRASPLLKYAAISEGVLVYEKDEDRRVEFEVKTMLEHFDLSFLRRVLWEGIIGRVKDGRFAKPDR